MEDQPRWEVDLGASYTLSSMNVYSRVEAPYRTSDFWVFVSATPFASTDLATTLADGTVEKRYYPGIVQRSATISVKDFT